MPPTARLDRAAIVDAALQIIERDGAESLSMRRLAAELDSKPMSLYHYVPNKAALLSLVLGEVAARIEWRTISGSPRDRMVGIIVDMHDKLSEIPWLIRVLREGVATGLPALTLPDQFITAANEAGFDDRRAFGLWRSCWDLVASELQFQTSRAERSPKEKAWFESVDAADLADYPAVLRILPEWPRYSAEFRVDEAVAMLIDGALATLA
ncbi:TetR/AcrR family transcriptional regulator [Gordonia sp. (in: high G+C Gram-positive bacteria)]|uniref:TetR/AcrR family transcriptional regulator n=1 Tax=Gordonia sp. (in: high G+C Gram-positive bacteria) TaxID=84139 RepID=UPI0039E375B8